MPISNTQVSTNLVNHSIDTDNTTNTKRKQVISGGKVMTRKYTSTSTSTSTPTTRLTTPISIFTRPKAPSTSTQNKAPFKKAKRSNSNENIQDNNNNDNIVSVDSPDLVEVDARSLLLPDPTKDVSPDAFLKQLVKAVCGYKPILRHALKMDNHFFKPITEAQIDAYQLSVVTATRENKLENLKSLYEQGNPLDCCNRFGESLLHMACRRGFTEIGAFLLEEASLNVRLSDDCGRNPFHDICWNHTPNLKLAQLLLIRDPALLLICDKRGHTPFQYSRKQDWPTWRQFLFDQRDHLESMTNDSNKNIFYPPEEHHL